MKFHDLKLTDLKKIAKEHNIKGHSTKNKDELASLLAKTHKITKDGVFPKQKKEKMKDVQTYRVDGGSIDHIMSELAHIKGRLNKVKEVMGGQLPRDIMDEVSSLRIE